MTRDALAGRTHPFDPIAYFARTSWTSQVAGPWTGTEAVGELHGRSGERMVQEDLRKLIVPRLAGERPDLLVIDLVDERFRVLEVDGTRVTLSDYLEQTPMAAPMLARASRVVEPASPRRIQDFARAAAVLAPRLVRAVGDVPIVLHTAWWTSTVVDPSQPLYASAPRAAATHNAALAAFARSLQSAFGPRLLRVQASTEVIRADAAHRWGLALYHYEPAYYDQVLAQLVEIAHGTPADRQRYRADQTVIVPPGADVGRWPGLARLRRRARGLARRRLPVRTHPDDHVAPVQTDRQIADRAEGGQQPADRRGHADLTVSRHDRSVTHRDPDL